MEIHVLEGTTSPDLRIAHLQFITPGATEVFPFAKTYIDDAANGNDVTLNFAVAAAKDDIGSSTRSFPNITVFPDTGAVKVDPLTGAFPRNFLVEVKVVGTTFNERIRVHVHRSIRNGQNDVWLTPSPLTVRAQRGAPLPFTTDFKLALRVRFDDDVIGDITDWDGITWSPAQSFTGKGRFIVRTGNAGNTVAVTASHPKLPRPAQAQVKVKQPWGTPNTIKAKLVAGGAVPTAATLNLRPNVLFLPDGFPGTQASQDAFHQYAASLVAFLSDNQCSPFNHLVGSMHFWSAFVPPEAPITPGVTWGAEVYFDPDSNVVRAVPAPVRPPSAVTQWTLENLIYEVGLPVAAEGPAGASTNDALMTRWDGLFGNGYRAKTSPLLVTDWRKLATRRLLDDKDTPLGMMSGAARLDLGVETIGLNPHRVSRTLMSDLLASMGPESTGPTKNLALGALWTQPTKRDYDLICVLTIGPGREKNDYGYFTISQQAQNKSVPGTLAGTNDITLNQPQPSATPAIDWKQVFVHELAHSFELGDEYGGIPTAPIAPAQQQGDRKNGNICGPLSLMRAGQIHGEEIKWRWPRITWAAEIKAAITDSGNGEFEVPVLPWRVPPPVEADRRFHLRFRDINYLYRDVPLPDDRASLVKEPEVSVPLQLLEATAAGNPPEHKLRLKVDSAAPFPYPVAKLITQANIKAKFPAGCIVYAPRPAPASVLGDSYPYAELIAKNVRDEITRLHGPVGHSAGYPPGLFDARIRAIPEQPTFAAGVIPKYWDAVDYPKFVALYEGGSQRTVGMYHATGYCKMNHQGSFGFCQVCRYILVDAIDPKFHDAIDDKYSEYYPLI